MHHARSAVDRERDRLDQTGLRDGRLRGARRRDLRRDVPAGPSRGVSCIDQIWFVARVSIVPTLVLSIPYTVLIVFTLNIVLIEVGAGDLSGAGAALASVTQVGPVVTAIVVVRRGRHRDVCRPRRQDHPRGDRRDEGHRRQPRPGAGGAPGDRGDIRCADALFGGRGRRAVRELLLRGVRPERHAGRLRRRA